MSGAKRRRRPGKQRSRGGTSKRSPGEYFLAAIGAAILVVLCLVIFTPSSCHRPSGADGPLPTRSP